MPADAPDFTKSERELVSRLLQDRYGKAVSPELADSELKLGRVFGIEPGTPFAPKNP